MPNSNPYHPHGVTVNNTAEAGGTIHYSPSPTSPKTLLPLNICGVSAHTPYTIPISYGIAQCLICNTHTHVLPQYTPGFIEKKRQVAPINGGLLAIDDSESLESLEPPDNYDGPEDDDDDEGDPGNG